MSYCMQQGAPVIESFSAEYEVYEKKIRTKQKFGNVEFTTFHHIELELKIYILYSTE